MLRVIPNDARNEASFDEAKGDATMKARSGYMRFARTVSRARRTSTVSLFLTLFATSSTFALGTPEQRKACTPDVYRLCAGEIPNARAITACLRRQKASLSEACKAVFEQ
jgi:hypothetical protein